jgi:hypothetical protein
LLLLILSASLIVLAADAMPAPFSWRTHSISESAAQGQHGAWIGRLAFLAFGAAVLMLALAARNGWHRAVFWCHLAFAVCMIGTAAFSHRPWNPPSAGDVTEDLLHSISATGMGFAFAFGVLARLLTRAREQRLRLTLDLLALAAATLLTPLAALLPDLSGLMQRSMFAIAYLWFGYEARTLPRHGRTR